METGERLKNLRLEAGYTQSALAKQLDIGQSTIVGYEKLEREPTLTNLIRYANFFKVTIDFLVGLEDDFGVRTAAPMGDTYTAEERKIITNLRKLPQGMRDILRTTIDAMVADIEKNNVAD